ncbi:hypothetical protein I79_025913 [Cricetulus griseus]|uniref:Uncharacterized protein n=1 Tax=Cricetulus griseus TaxID=10029 RepID=G3IPK1_CRIGR|nr:hypothetical protein I79_025913 [Cricetulus griseus]
MVPCQALERPQRAALEFHEAFAFAGTPKLCPSADALLCKQNSKSKGNEEPKEAHWTVAWTFLYTSTQLMVEYVQALDLDLA